MSATLYLLRRQPDSISPSLFRPSETDMDVVFIEKAAGMHHPSVKGSVVAVEGESVVVSHPTLTYDELVDKIFSSERVIVL